MKKNIKSFLREEDGKTIKKSILISSLWLITWFALTAWTDASHGNNHLSWTGTDYHSSTHANHSNHSSY